MSQSCRIPLYNGILEAIVASLMTLGLWKANESVGIVMNAASCGLHQVCACFGVRVVHFVFVSVCVFLCMYFLCYLQPARIRSVIATPIVDYSWSSIHTYIHNNYIETHRHTPKCWHRMWRLAAGVPALREGWSRIVAISWHENPMESNAGWIL